MCILISLPVNVAHITLACELLSDFVYNTGRLVGAKSSFKLTIKFIYPAKTDCAIKIYTTFIYLIVYQRGIYRNNNVIHIGTASYMYTYNL